MASCLEAKEDVGHVLALGAPYSCHSIECAHDCFLLGPAFPLYALNWGKVGTEPDPWAPSLAVTGVTWTCQQSVSISWKRSRGCSRVPTRSTASSPRSGAATLTLYPARGRVR